MLCVSIFVITKGSLLLCPCKTLTWENISLCLSLSHTNTLKMACLRFGNSERGRTGQGWVESCRLSDWKHSVAEALFFNPPDNIIPALFIFLLELLLNIPPSLSSLHTVHFFWRPLSLPRLISFTLPLSLRLLCGGDFQISRSHKLFTPCSCQGAKYLFISEVN